MNVYCHFDWFVPVHFLLLIICISPPHHQRCSRRLHNGTGEKFYNQHSPVQILLPALGSFIASLYSIIFKSSGTVSESGWAQEVEQL